MQLLKKSILYLSFCLSKVSILENFPYLCKHINKNQSIFNSQIIVKILKINDKQNIISVHSFYPLLPLDVR